MITPSRRLQLRGSIASGKALTQAEALDLLDELDHAERAREQADGERENAKREVSALKLELSQSREQLTNTQRLSRFCRRCSAGPGETCEGGTTHADRGAP